MCEKNVTFLAPTPLKIVFDAKRRRQLQEPRKSAKISTRSESRGILALIEKFF